MQVVGGHLTPCVSWHTVMKTLEHWARRQKQRSSSWDPLLLCDLWPDKWQFDPRFLSGKMCPWDNTTQHTHTLHSKALCHLTLFIVTDNGKKWKYRKQLYPCMVPALTWWERSSPAMFFSVSLWNIYNAKMGSWSMQCVVLAGWNHEWTWKALVSVA